MIKHYSKGKITSVEASIDGKELVWSHIKPDINVISGPNGSGKGELLYYMSKYLDLGTSLHYEVSDNSSEAFTCMVEKFNDELEGPKEKVISLINSRLAEYCNGFLFDPKEYVIGDIIDAGYYQFVFPNMPKSEGIKRLITMYLWVYNIQHDGCYTDKEAFMDNPDVYLSFDLVKKLIGDFITIAPDVQFFISTYNPALIIEGWQDKVVEITDLYIKPL